jgi:hypothetical protein
MTDSLFVRDGDAVVPTVFSTGPWSEQSLHGGPVAALLADALEAMPTAGPMFPARLTVELLRPVGHEPMRIDTRVVRGGRKVQVLEATLARSPGLEPSAETTVARATLQQIHRVPVPLPDDVEAPNGPDPAPPPPEAFEPQDARFGDEVMRYHTESVEHRGAANFLGDDGPALDWIRLVKPVFPDRAITPLARVAAAADFGNGISRILPFGRYLFLNPDLTIHLYRLPVDEWVCLDAITRLDTTGDGGSVGLAESVLWGRNGRLGRSQQSLLIDPLPDQAPPRTG